MAYAKFHVLAFFCGLFISGGFARAPQKILKGEYASIEDFPYAVSIQTLEGEHFCGGTIISHEYILTAAHCITHLQSSEMNISVVTGTNDRLNRTIDNVFAVSQFAIHENYDMTHNWNNDIGILKVSRPIPFNKYQAAAQLPTEDLPPSSSVTLSGWGSTEFDLVTATHGPYSQYLKKLEVDILDKQQCWNRLKGTDMTAIFPGHICGYSPNGADGCNGDSGSPLIYKSRILVGISSFGFACGNGYPNFSTRVYYYLHWIRETIKILNKL